MPDDPDFPGMYRTLPEGEQWGMFAEHLLDLHEEEAWLKRQTKQKTLYRLKGTPAGSFEVIKRPYSEAVKQYILGKFPDAEIMNERFK